MSLSLLDWGLDAQFFSSRKMLCTTVSHDVQCVSVDDHFEYYLWNRPINKVEVCGMIVDMQHMKKSMWITIDDGTSVIRCVKYFEMTNGVDESSRFRTFESGNMTIIRGTLRSLETNEFDHCIVININFIDIIEDPNLEAHHWIDSMRLYQEEYSMKLPVQSVIDINREKMTAFRSSSSSSSSTAAAAAASLYSSDFQNIDKPLCTCKKEIPPKIDLKSTGIMKRCTTTEDFVDEHVLFKVKSRTWYCGCVSSQCVYDVKCELRIALLNYHFLNDDNKTDSSESVLINKAAFVTDANLRCLCSKFIEHSTQTYIQALYRQHDSIKDIRSVCGYTPPESTNNESMVSHILTDCFESFIKDGIYFPTGTSNNYQLITIHFLVRMIKSVVRGIVPKPPEGIDYKALLENDELRKNVVSELKTTVNTVPSWKVVDAIQLIS